MFKIALLIGINYSGDSELFGCLNDVDNLEKILKEQYKYNFIFKLKNEEASKKAILSSINWITQLSNSYSACEIWVSYSGHGSYEIDKSGDEEDGQDEVIVPYDYKDNGTISDDTLNNFVRQINQRSKCIMLFDCCHSGTILDLKYQYNDGSWSENIKANDIKANVIMLSGCTDKQTSADAYNIENSGMYQGALTTSFINILKKSGYTVTIDELLDKIRKYLSKRGFEQIPQITCSKQFGKKCLFSKNNQGIRFNSAKFFIP
jgi:metacaspase-1